MINSGINTASSETGGKVVRSVHFDALKAPTAEKVDDFRFPEPQLYRDAGDKADPEDGRDGEPDGRKGRPQGDVHGPLKLIVQGRLDGGHAFRG